MAALVSRHVSKSVFGSSECGFLLERAVIQRLKQPRPSQATIVGRAFNNDGKVGAIIGVFPGCWVEDFWCVNLGGSFFLKLPSVVLRLVGLVFEKDRSEEKEEKSGNNV